MEASRGVCPMDRRQALVLHWLSFVAVTFGKNLASLYLSFFIYKIGMTVVFTS
jgi:hypothetical protein